MPIHIKAGDITKEKACAIVNAANRSLMGGGGVDGAIHRAGGPAILAACKEVRRTQYPDGLPTGEAVATTAGNLPAQYVIHTVGPIWGRCGDRCDELLANAYRNSLKVAVELGCDSVVFPAISTGVYGFPADRAAKIAYKTVKDFLKSHPDMDVTFIFHSDRSRKVFEKATAH
ncbi:O-acetyl-ADP-ribose deacetylase [Hydrogenimonas urashimensis]|uniref:O-acetyl-ADP-ribose deacetylase n=1 Tax=Hydrogenimonas urashimensis TaxID=2740515 RepID=UPI0019168338|nr:O-acetyl-ADP-ribose deacetylase [Hydrogenimonas urashimensis]